MELLVKAVPVLEGCTKNDRGRSIARLLKAELKDKLERQYDEPDSQKTYALRKAKVELPLQA